MQKLEKKQVAGGASWKLLKTKVQICNSRVEKMEGGGQGGKEGYPPLRADESCTQAVETKRVKCVSVVHAGIAEERKAKETKEIGTNAENPEANMICGWGKTA